MNDERKEAALKASDTADRLTDSVMGKVMASRWSWAVLGTSHITAFVLGWWAGR